MLRSIYKSIAPTQGTIYIDDIDVLNSPNKKVAKHLGVVGQFNELNFDLTVEQMVLLGRTPHKKMMEADNLYDHQRVQEALLRTNLMNYKDRSYISLSGGEKQRVILARTIAQEPQVMILDEPTNHLDIRYQLEILTAVKDLNITTFVALHDLELTACYCDYIYRTYYESGALNWEIPYKNDKKNGIEKGYYESGALEWEVPYKNGKENGIEKEYYESGAMRWAVPCKNDKMNGLAKGYYESGALAWEVPYKNGKENGIEKEYFSSGESTATYRNGILQGYKHCSDGRIGNDNLDCSVQ